VTASARTIAASGKGRFDAHRRVARFALPAWLYVSVTGVLVYVMLYWVAPIVS
jgi:putative membrane protein